ncbi:MAG: glutamine synthetase [Clostridiales bacterium]|nr:glutamine synthetase [Clostridiales bacterium]
MTSSKSEVLEYVRENNVKFVKLTFCDMLGRQRNISVLSSQLEDAYENGVAIDSSAVTGVGGIDLKLMPVSSLLSDLPWRPHSGKVVSVFCRLANIDRTPYACDPMVMLEKQVSKLKELGLTAEVATECEFYVFKEVEDALEPIDYADYCACPPLDKCESLRRDVILSLEDMGLKPISSHHERGPGQNEVDFESADPLSAARNFIMFKSAVKNVCAINGAHASFQPMPMSGQPGSGLHLSITLSGKNKAAATRAFAEGVLRRCKEITCFANPTVNSYKRIKSRKISYDSLRGMSMRIFGDDDSIIQLRTPDSSCNIFAVLALIFAAGREGIEGKFKLREAGEGEHLFENIGEAIEFARESEWLHGHFPEQLDNILDTLSHRCEEASKLTTDLEFFKFYSDI